MPIVSNIEVSEESPNASGVADLLAESDAFAAALYPAESNHMIGVADLVAPGASFFVARIAGRAVGCGAVVTGREPAFGEIKRMFVRAEARGQGAGRMILQALERAARDAGVWVLRLETGVANTEALALYKRHGYLTRGPFDSYTEDPLSIFMEKSL
jgi:putative acetyltransferase